MQTCKHNYDQYKRILEAIEEDKINTKRVRTNADNGLLYNEICLRKL